MSASVDLLDQVAADVKYESPPPQTRKLEVQPPKAIDLRDDKDPDRIKAIRDGVKAYNASLYEKAFECFKIAANWRGGSALGMYYLGSLYLFAKGTKKNAILGLAFLKGAAQAGLRQACFDLGLRYFIADDLPKDWQLARHYWENLPRENIKYRYYYGVILYLGSEKGEERGLGREYIFSAARDGYLLAKKIIADFEELDLLQASKDEALALIFMEKTSQIVRDLVQEPIEIMEKNSHFDD